MLSIGQLQEKGLTVLIQNGTYKVFHPSRGLIMHSDRSGNKMFYLLAKMVSNLPKCMQVEADDESRLWHSRFGHLNYKGLRTLAYRGMVEGLPTVKTPQKLCTHCLVGGSSTEIPFLKEISGEQHTNCSLFTQIFVVLLAQFPTAIRGIS